MKTTTIETPNGLARLATLPGKVHVLFDERGAQLVAFSHGMKFKTAETIAWCIASDILRIRADADREGFARGLKSGERLHRENLRAAARIVFAPFADLIGESLADALRAHQQPAEKHDETTTSNRRGR